LYKENIIPHMVIHDSLVVSCKNDEEAKKVCEIMENTVYLKIPMKVDVKKGPNWGNLQKIEEE
jgi:DNA polymerase I-like protein with 3'-5' exonuclease and polymerase domains